MAFVFKSERPAIGHQKDQFPGPGTYQAPEAVYEDNFVPFNSSGKKLIPQKPMKSPGPGTYNAPVSVQGYNPQQKVFYSRLNPEVETTEEKRQSKVFKSSTKRFSHTVEQEMPGPGSYAHDASSFKKPLYSNTGLIARSVSLKENDDRKGGVPSIPSFVHAYGYTEMAGRELRLNNNPLLEIQKFVGPGYYETQNAKVIKPKGAAWHKSQVEKCPDLCVTSTGSNIGPGRYKPKLRGILPLYKLKPSANFASKTIRDAKAQDISKKQKRLRQMDIAKRTGLESLQDKINAEKGEDSSDEEAPGPGYYHNTTKSTSFAQTSQKPLNQQNFGSGNERFGDSFSSSSHVGPGKYDTRKNFGKKYEKNLDFKGPFLTAEKRFVEQYEEIPGPGMYDVRTQIGANMAAKPKGDNLESFGATDIRFKPDEEEVPGPGAYLHQKAKSQSTASPASYMFSSTSKREVIQTNNADVPAPGAYEVGVYDVSSKIKKAEQEDPELTPIKPPFNSGTERFKSLHHKIDEQDDDNDEEDDAIVDGEWTSNGMTRGDLILKIRNQPKTSSMFSSKTKREGVPMNEKEKSFIPGPGKYNGFTSDEWITKTYNVNFTAD